MVDLPRRAFLLTLGAALIMLGMFCATTFDHDAWSQTARTIRLINPFPAGGSVDVLARVLAEEIGRRHGVTIVIENRPGAGAVIGAEAAARAAPDGNTLLLVATGFVVSPHLRKGNYDPLSGFEPICNLVQSPQLIVVNATSPYRGFADLVNAARAKPGSLTLAGPGPATAAHIAFEMFKRAANVDMSFIPFPGTAPALNALLGEHVTSANLTYTDAAEHLKSGKLRALATPGRTRIEPLPGLPTVAEAGFHYEVEIWFGVVAPAKTPKDMVAQLIAWFTAATAAREVHGKLVALGFYPDGRCGADFGALLHKQFDGFGGAIRAANIKAE